MFTNALSFTARMVIRLKSLPEWSPVRFTKSEEFPWHPAQIPTSGT